MRRLFFLAVLSIVCMPAVAATIVVSAPSLMPANGIIDWSTLGVDGIIVDCPFDIVTTNGIVVQVLQGLNPVTRVDQGTSWDGNFNPGDPLIWTNGSWGPIIMDFESAISGAGARIQAAFSGPYTARISAYDGTTLLGAYELSGISNTTGSGDGSAVFIGILSDSTNISRIVFAVPYLQDFPNLTENFAVGNVLVQEPSSVPEPASFGFGGLGLVLICALRPGRRQ